MRHGDNGLYRQRVNSRNFTFTRVRCVRSDPELAARWLGKKVTHRTRNALNFKAYHFPMEIEIWALRPRPRPDRTT
jgi:hypothetical protein